MSPAIRLNLRAVPLQLSPTHSVPQSRKSLMQRPCLCVIFCHPQPWDGPGHLLCQGSLGTQGTLSRELAGEEVSRG